ncbi:hypothetical protein VNI00_004318 [Paramarasmius palmivorus]|uniref:Uncharacterized protein n=1 Tax=Paramarasmius palmivorus TaxID=297713 RepID=A0AAW0DMJ6_9AGAR
MPVPIAYIEIAQSVRQPRRQSKATIEEIKHQYPDYTERALRTLRSIGHDLEAYDCAPELDPVKIINETLNLLGATEEHVDYAALLDSSRKKLMIAANKLLDLVEEGISADWAWYLEDYMIRLWDAPSPSNPVRTMLLEFYIPATEDGMEAARLLQNSNEPIRINLFGIQTLDHARECAMTGAEMVTIHIGLDRGKYPAPFEHPMLQVVRDTLRCFQLNGFSTQLSVSGLPTREDVIAIDGFVHSAFLSPDVIQIEDAEPSCQSIRDHIANGHSGMDDDLELPMHSALSATVDFSIYDEKIEHLLERLFIAVQSEARNRDIEKHKPETVPDHLMSPVLNDVDIPRAAKRGASDYDVTRASSGKRSRNE